ncbi:MAG: NADH-quinone oxidoreductase subunit N [Thermoanaerobacterales bacterium]|nr:NADH-quinone oxidoreductase subunit N [Thermoanaerobacterales bacterium]
MAVFGSLSQPLPADPTPVETPSVDWAAAAPLLVLVGGALVLMLWSSFVRSRRATHLYTAFTCLVAVGAIGAVVPLWREVQDADRGPFSTFGGAVGVDGFSLFMTVVIAVAVALAALFIDDYLRREQLESVEPFVLVLLSAAGGVIMSQANDLIVLFLGLEILSIAVYVLAASHRRRVTSQEAGVKYFVLGAFSSAFFLYGIALVYGGTGTTNLIEILEYFSTTVVTDDGLVLAGLALMLVGLGFKVAAVPFHFWTPDVYQGSPTPMVTWMASGVKAAGFAGLIRVLVLAFDAYAVDWQPIVFALAVATLFVGAVLAVVQTDVKRMMAYSSINHAGFVLVGVQAATDQGVEAALFYLAAYTFLIAGTFGVITLVGRRGDGHHRLDDYRGLARTQPGLALVLTLFLLAQAGVPLTSGFFAKFYVIVAAVDAGSTVLAVVAMLSSVISAYLYLRITVSLYMSDPTEEGAPRLRVPVAAGIALALCVAVTLVAGVWPGSIAETARDAVPVLAAVG